MSEIARGPSITEYRKDPDEAPYKQDFIEIVFDGPPGHESGRFVEVENSHRESIGIGRWVKRNDGTGMWALRIRTLRLHLRERQFDAEDYQVDSRCASRHPELHVNCLMLNTRDDGTHPEHPHMAYEENEQVRW